MAKLAPHIVPLTRSDVILYLSLDLRSKQVAIPIPIERIQEGDFAGRSLDNEGVLRLPPVIQAITIGVSKIRISAQLHLLSICQTISVRVAERTVVRIRESLVLLPCLFFVINRGEWNITGSWLAVIEWI